MARLHTLRNTPWLVKLALLWFVLTLGAAVASPMVNPQTERVICTSAGMLKVVLADDGSVTAATSDALFCPLCLLGAAPPPARVHAPQASHALGLVRPSIQAARIAALTASPPPARGPPSASML